MSRWLKVLSDTGAATNLVLSLFFFVLVCDDVTFLHICFFNPIISHGGVLRRVSSPCLPDNPEPQNIPIQPFFPFVFLSFPQRPWSYYPVYIDYLIRQEEVLSTWMIVYFQKLLFLHEINDCIVWEIRNWKELFFAFLQTVFPYSLYVIALLSERLRFNSFLFFLRWYKL